MRSRSERQTHSDQLAEDEAQDALRPRRPAEGAINSSRRTSVRRDEAINPSRQTSAQRMKQSAPTRRTGAQRVKDQRQTSTAGLSRGRRTSVNSVHSARAACEGPTSTPQWQHSLVGDSKVNPCNRDHAPRFLWRETLEKSQTVQPLLLHPKPEWKVFGAPRPISFTSLNKTSTKVHRSSGADRCTPNLSRPIAALGRQARRLGPPR